MFPCDGDLGVPISQSAHRRLSQLVSALSHAPSVLSSLVHLCAALAGSAAFPWPDVSLCAPQAVSMQLSKKRRFSSKTLSTLCFGDTVGSIGLFSTGGLSASLRFTFSS